MDRSKQETPAPDPRIPKIKALLEKRPETNLSTIRFAFQVGEPLIRKWAAAGLIPMPYITPKHKMGSKWRRDGSGWLSPKKYQRNLLTQQDERIKK